MKRLVVLATLIACVAYLSIRVVNQVNPEILQFNATTPLVDQVPRIESRFVSDGFGTIKGQPSSVSETSESHIVMIDDEPGVVRPWVVTTVKGRFKSGDRVHCFKTNQRVVIDATGYQGPVFESIACDLAETGRS